MTVQVDDAGVGDLLFGAIIGAHGKETGEFHYDIIPVNYFQTPHFRKKLYLKNATELTLRLLQEMKLGADEDVEICRSFVFDETREELFRKFGKEKVKTAIISGDAQHNVETAYLDYIRNIGYEHRPDRIDVRLPQDVKENILSRGMASRSPEPHDREGWVSMKLGKNSDLPALTRLLHQSYRFTSSLL